MYNIVYNLMYVYYFIVAVSDAFRSCQFHTSNPFCFCFDRSLLDRTRLQQGFPMKQGVLVNHRVRLLFKKAWCTIVRFQNWFQVTSPWRFGNSWKVVSPNVLLHLQGMSCYRERRKGCRKRKSVRGSIPAWNCGSTRMSVTFFLAFAM